MGHLMVAVNQEVNHGSHFGGGADRCRGLYIENGEASPKFDVAQGDASPRMVATCQSQVRDFLGGVHQAFTPPGHRRRAEGILGGVT